MIQYININDINILRKILKEIEFGNRIDLFSAFPFKDLMDSSSDQVSLLVDILEYFSISRKFLQNRNNSLSYTIEFALANISYFTKNKDNIILCKLIEFLNKIFKWTRFIHSAINLEIDTCRITDLIIPLLINGELKYRLVSLLTSVLWMQEIFFPDCEIVDYCISECFICLEPERPELPMLVVASFRAYPRLLLSQRNGLYRWLYQDCPQLLEKKSDETQILLDCIILAFETRVEKDYKLIDVYRHKISILYGMLRSKMFYKHVMKIFSYIIYDFISIGKLPMLPNECIKEMEFEINVKYDIGFNDNIIIVINYLRCLYCQTDIDKEEVRNCIINKCLQSAFYSSPILKALCLLYPILFHSQKRDYVSFLVENNLLDAAQRCSYLNLIVTYHSLQLQWFLTSNRPNLQIRALELYLINYKDSKVILNALKTTSTMELLVNCLLNETNSEVAKRAVTLLSELECHKTSILIKNKLPISIRSETSLGCLFNAKPALPTSEKEGVLFCAILSRILPALNERDAFIGTCSYSSNLLGKFKNCAGAIQEFILNGDCIVRICDAASSEDEGVALPAVVMLIIFMKLQRRHLIRIHTSIPIDFRNLFKGSCTRHIKVLNLLNLLHMFSITKCLISIPREQILNLYQYILQLQCGEAYSLIFATLVKLQKTYSFLAYLPSTMAYMELHTCRIYKTDDQMKQFLIFLTDWLEKIGKEEIDLYGNLDKINAFLRCRPPTYQNLLKLLQKCSSENS